MVSASLSTTLDLRIPHLLIAVEPVQGFAPKGCLRLRLTGSGCCRTRVSLGQCLDPSCEKG